MDYKILAKSIAIVLLVVLATTLVCVALAQIPWVRWVFLGVLVMILFGMFTTLVYIELSDRKARR